MSIDLRIKTLLEKISSNNISLGKRRVNSAQNTHRSGFAKGFIAASATAAGIYALSKKGAFTNINVKKVLDVLKDIPYLVLGFLLGAFGAKRVDKAKDEIISDKLPEETKDIADDTNNIIVVIQKEPEAKEQYIEPVIVEEEPVMVDIPEQQQIIEDTDNFEIEAQDAVEDEIYPIEEPVYTEAEEEPKQEGDKDDRSKIDLIFFDELSKAKKEKDEAMKAFHFEEFKRSMSQPDDKMTTDEMNRTLNEFMSKTPVKAKPDDYDEIGKIAQKDYVQYIRKRFNIKKY